MDEKALNPEFAVGAPLLMLDFPRSLPKLSGATEGGGAGFGGLNELKLAKSAKLVWADAGTGCEVLMLPKLELVLL